MWSPFYCRFVNIYFRCYLVKIPMPVVVGNPLLVACFTGLHGLPPNTSYTNTCKQRYPLWLQVKTPVEMVGTFSFQWKLLFRMASYLSCCKIWELPFDKVAHGSAVEYLQVACCHRQCHREYNTDCRIVFIILSRASDFWRKAQRFSWRINFLSGHTFQASLVVIDELFNSLVCVFGHTCLTQILSKYCDAFQSKKCR